MNFRQLRQKIDNVDNYLKVKFDIVDNFDKLDKKEKQKIICKYGKKFGKAEKWWLCRAIFSPIVKNNRAG